MGKNGILIEVNNEEKELIVLASKLTSRSQRNYVKTIAVNHAKLLEKKHESELNQVDSFLDKKIQELDGKKEVSEE